MGKCHITYCNDGRVGYGSFCEAHTRARRRHGHPEQRGVRSSEIEPFRQLVKARLREPDGNRLKHLLQEQWQGLITEAAKHEESVKAGDVYVQWHRTAYQAITKVATQADPLKGATELTAVVMLYIHNESRFKDHNALTTQLARRFYRQTDHHVGTFFNHADQRVKRVYREVSPRVLRFVGQFLLDEFGGAASAFHNWTQKGITERQQRMKALGRLDRTVSKPQGEPSA